MKKLCTAFVTLTIFLIPFIVNAETFQVEPTTETSLFAPTVETTTPSCAVAGKTVHISIPADLDNMIYCINIYDSTGVTYVLDNDIIINSKLKYIANNVFNGIFDGNNKIIWYYNSSSPLFFFIGPGAIVKNFTFHAPRIEKIATESLTEVSTLAAYLDGGRIESVAVHSGSIIVNNSRISLLQGVGGLVQAMSGGTIRNSSFTGQIALNAQNIVGVGGIVGGQNGGRIESVQSSGTLYVMGESQTNSLGGIVGGQYAGLIIHSKSDMQIGVDIPKAAAIGGIAGSQGNLESATIRDGIFSGRITVWDKKNQGTKTVGGIVGHQIYGQILFSKTEKKPGTQDSSAITIETFGQHIGGLVGSQESNGLIYSSYSNTHLIFNNNSNSESIPSFIGGLVGTASGTIRNSYAQESITFANADIVGGLVGYLYEEGRIEDCYSAVETNNSIKGVVGGISEPNHAKCHNSYWDTDKAHSDESLLCEDGGRTTYAMTYYDPNDTYVDWKSNIWNLQQSTYPTLKYRQ